MPSRATIRKKSANAAPVRHTATSLASGAQTFKGRLGLCCLFVEEPIQFRTTTAASLMRLDRASQLQKLSKICLSNCQALLKALQYCASQGIGAFRIVSSLLPLKTQPQVGYELSDLPESIAILAALEACRTFAAAENIRTSFHPDQFVVLNSPRPEVVEHSLADLQSHADLAELIGADVINIHGGGAFGDKAAALTALTRQIERLPDRVRSLLTLENDDRVFSPADLLPVCRSTGVPFVYDVHHHRCLADDLSVEFVTEAAIATWDREPLFHLSSPLEGWSGPRPHRHHDFIDPADFPSCWLPLSVTVDIEAKAKEKAVLQLRSRLGAATFEK
jgi:UV DNA damage endonuclease